MKILFAADGSNFTKKPLAFLITHENIAGPEDSNEIVAPAAREGSQMIVMGTHGHGLIGRALVGSIAQRVIADSNLPVLLVK